MCMHTVLHRTHNAGAAAAVEGFIISIPCVLSQLLLLLLLCYGPATERNAITPAVPTRNHRIPGNPTGK